MSIQTSHGYATYRTPEEHAAIQQRRPLPANPFPERSIGLIDTLVSASKAVLGLLR